MGIAIAKALACKGEQAEIINADAYQMYRGMDIGTAKPDAEKSGRFGGLGSRLPFGAKPDDAKKDDKSAAIEKPAAASAARSRASSSK